MLTRRRLATLFGALTLGLGTNALHAEEIIDLDWDDLIPDGGSSKFMKLLRDLGVVQHGQLSTGFDQETARAVTTEFDGKIVRLPGFMVPLEFDADGVTTFILAPFVGACIHVPPPPANQLVLVTSSEPYAFKGLFDPVLVTGMFGVAATGTALAEIGYALSAEKIIAYD